MVEVSELNDVSELYQERFRVDRGKLEKMLIGVNHAKVFFARVMKDTDTVITWPNKLKIGPMSKKDPHVKIAGKPDDVRAAKERILTVLNPRCNHVTMKMDFSYTDHSHIIGKGGSVIEEPRCHIHFPDSNRSNPNEKSNQVSISGDIEGVERARSRLRDLIPLIFGFELRIMSQTVDGNSPYVIKIQEQYRVQVMFKTRPKPHATLVLVKGLEWEVHQVKQATLLLMEFMCENLASHIPVQMSMEISPHHHQIVLAKNHSNLKAIMQYTNCQIVFPDPQDPNIPDLKKSNVKITGNIHNVYRARQLLMGSLPLIIKFDLPNESPGLRITPKQIAKIQTSCDVVININIRPNANKTTKACVVIEGIERLATNIYKARNLVLGIDKEPPTLANIPSTYHMPTAPSAAQATDLPTPTTLNPPPISLLLSPLITPTWYCHSPTLTPPPFIGMTKQRQFFFDRNMKMIQQNINGSSGSKSTVDTFIEELSIENEGDPYDNVTVRKPRRKSLATSLPEKTPEKAPETEEQTRKSSIPPSVPLLVVSLSSMILLRLNS